MIKYLAEIFAPTGIAAVFIYILKKHLEASIAHRFKEQELKQKLVLEEVVRRQGKIFDEQFENGKLLCTVTYRLKNLCHTISYFVQKGQTYSQFEDDFKQFRQNSDLLVDTLYSDKMIMEDDVFKVVHDLKHACTHFTDLIMRAHATNRDCEPREIEKVADKIEQAHYQALAMYKQAVDGKVLQ
ncbi:hypothetical protein MUGA111182_19865 [Mucilaginibacter galii]|uniref:Uncharacterized protein n=1 Tax=Mucilaginibacter galii TaxID=2005073 RepID=A0A917N2V8_9SPHI|nr:hypothetical protein [Mucilaginibacter galii]GGI52400.1 hypothetical protein GCM10011425_36120 [Mucilaginibacter galii]